MFRKTLTILVLAVVAGALVSNIAEARKPAPLRGFDRYVRRSMHAWHLPGLAVAVVKDGKIVMAKGFGVRELGKPAKVDKDTVFAIASNSKAFTTVSLGTLVDAGKLRWNDHITNYVKDLKLYNAYPTRELTVRDLLTHRSGICNAGFLEYGTNNTRADIIHKLLWLKPAYSFRAHFCYSNIMVMAAAQAIPAISGKSWRDAVQTRIFKPLHMTHSSALIRNRHRGNIATPHATVDGKIQPIRYYRDYNDAPAGGVTSSVSDMAHWLQMLLAKGQYQGRRIVSPAVIDEMETPQISIPPDTYEGRLFNHLVPQMRSLSYGLTFFMNDYRGEHIVWHYGETDGMKSALGMIPSRHLGMVVLSNLQSSWLPVALMYRVFDDYLGAPKQDWSKEMQKAAAKFQAKQNPALEKLKNSRVPDAHPSLPLTAYTGTYTDQLYGEVTVSKKNGHLVLKRGWLFTGDLRPWNHNTFRVTWRYNYLGKDYAEFIRNPAGQIGELRLLGSGTFTRRSSADFNVIHRH